MSMWRGPSVEVREVHGVEYFLLGRTEAGRAATGGGLPQQHQEKGGRDLPERRVGVPAVALTRLRYVPGDPSVGPPAVGSGTAVSPASSPGSSEDGFAAWTRPVAANAAWIILVASAFVTPSAQA